MCYFICTTSNFVFIRKIYHICGENREKSKPFINFIK